MLEEQKTQSVLSNYLDDVIVREFFKLGAKIQLERCCEYLKYNIYQFGTEQDKTWEEQVEIFVNRFKRAMEEQI